MPQGRQEPDRIRAEGGMAVKAATRGFARNGGCDMPSIKIRRGIVTLLLAGALLAAQARAAQEAGDQRRVEVVPLGQSVIGSPALGQEPPADQPEFVLARDHVLDLADLAEFPGASPVRAAVPLAIPDAPSNGIALVNPGFSGFNGLTHRDQRLSGGGNQFSLEPPDQALCVGNGFVLEVVNDVLAVFTEDGTRVAGPTTANSFFHLPPAIRRPAPFVFGPFLSDPRCLFDAATNRFFVAILEIDVDPATGAFRPGSHLLIAVSRTGDSTGAFNLFSIDVTADGNFGTTGPRRCPCFGDQPLIGANADGFFISTNAFSLVTGRFAGAQIYALSKAALTSGAGPKSVRFFNLVVPGGFAASIQPAASPPGGGGDHGRRGTEFLASIFDLRASVEDHLVVWAIDGTNTLGSATPRLRLTNTVIRSEVFAVPPDATQKAGPIPLGDLVGETEEMLSTGDHRLQQVLFVDGKLFTAVTTAVGSAANQRSGIAFFIIEAESEDEGVQAKVHKQGYVALANNFLFYPSFVANGRDRAAIVFSFSGPDFFPGVGFVEVREDGRAGRIHVAAAGVAPDDGFTGYAAFDGAGSGRWGDYSAAAIGQDGSIWMAAEYIPNLPRTLLANWGTFVARLRIGEHDDD
jgi:hypothetical protein